MAALRELFARFDTQFNAAPLLAGAAAVDGLFGKLKTLGGALVGGAIVAGFTALVHNAIESGHALIVTSEQLGVSADALKTWQTLAKTTGVETEELNTSLKFLQKNAYGASQGGEEQAKAFKKLHVNVKDANGQLKSGDVLLREIADGMANTENETTRVALAQQLLGRSGSKLLPLLKDGSKGLDEMQASLAALGISFSADGARAAEEAHKKILLFDLVVGSMRAKLVNAVIPTVTVFFGWLAKGAGYMNNLVKGTSAVQAILTVLGVVATAVAFKTLIAFAPVVATTLLWAAAVAALVLALDDVIALFSGGNSLIGEWIDKNYGAGTAAEWVKDAKQWWDELTPSVATAWEGFKSILPTIESVGKALKFVAETIAFVVDQFKSSDLKGQGAALANFLGKDIGKAFGVDLRTDDEKKFAHGAEGFGSGPATSRGGFYADAQRLPGDLPSLDRPRVSPGGGVFTLPEVTIPGGKAPAQGPKVHNEVNINVAANAKPDPQLLTAMKKVATDVLDAQNVQLAAAVGGN